MQYISSNFTILAANYDCNAYSAGTYNNTDCISSTSPGTSGGLADTGYNILIPAALGLALVVAGIILLVTRLVRRKKSSAK